MDKGVLAHINEAVLSSEVKLNLIYHACVLQLLNQGLHGLARTVGSGQLTGDSELMVGLFHVVDANHNRRRLVGHLFCLFAVGDSKKRIYSFQF